MTIVLITMAVKADFYNAILHKTIGNSTAVILYLVANKNGESVSVVNAKKARNSAY
ncbi:hypothetical protein GCM10022386_08240 [Flavobacterium cheonhonense]|uniref:Uncharacterized protein n=1 Tax=Flavobacterium cheonhonense TaxID=706185 RepID=A0ABP7TK01_9FLAO